MHREKVTWVFPKIRGTPKWMVYNGKPYQNGWFGGTTIFGNIHIFQSLSSCWEICCSRFPKNGPSTKPTNLCPEPNLDLYLRIRLQKKLPKEEVLRTLELQTTTFYGCFNWMIPNHYIKNGSFTKHPLQNGCLGYQEIIKQCIDIKKK